MIFRIKFWFNVIFTISIIFFTINLFFTFMPQVGNDYWPWFASGWIVLIERWVMFFLFEKKVIDVRKKLENKEDKFKTQEDNDNIYINLPED